jgi:hypothetical protein
MKEYSTRKLKRQALFDNSITPPDVIAVLPPIMDKRTSMALMTMSRLQESNRIMNHTLSRPPYNANCEYPSSTPTNSINANVELCELRRRESSFIIIQGGRFGKLVAKIRAPLSRKACEK